MFFCQLTGVAISICVAVIFAVIGSIVLYKVVDAIVSISVDEAEEVTGLDLAEHGERGYTTPIFTGSSSFFGADSPEASLQSAFGGLKS